jgi:hypothetical protein
MGYTNPEHYSYKFKFDIDKLPAVQKDRTSRRFSYAGVLFGLFFVLLSLFDIYSCFLTENSNNYDFTLPKNVATYDVVTLRYAFDAFILLFGMLIVGISVISMQRYKKICFDGDKIIIKHHPLWKEPTIETENLYNYLGVLLKVENYQFGLINRNRYIIELYHKDKNKRIPLYICTGSRNVRGIWEYYAEKLKMPALFMTDHGLISRHYNELHNTLKDMAKKWHLKTLYHNDEDMPPSVKYTIKKNKAIVKEKHLFFDVYSILAFIGLIMLGTLLGYSLWNYMFIIPYIGIWGLAGGVAVCVALILFSLIIILSKDVLIVTENDVILGHNLLFLRMNADILPKNKIEAVDIGHNPTTERYYLSVISHDKNIVFGKNMPIDDLRWVRGFIIREIVK